MTMTDPVTTVRQYIEAFNRGDSKAMAAAFTDPGWILDGIAPHVWHGPTATQDWYRDMLVEAEHLGASRFVFTLGKPRHVDVTEDSAYGVVPASMTFKAHGKQVKQPGATLAVALRRLAEGWRIAAWAIAKGGQA
jgi:ketosteroid isomerase-like protein